jgi:Tol biopolymer transport system component
VVPAFGGQPRMIAREGRHPRFSPDGKWLVYDIGKVTSGAGLGGPLEVAPVTGGVARRIGNGIFITSHPLWTPDGQHVLCYGSDGKSFDWWVVPVNAGEPVKTGAFDALRKAGFKVDGDDAPIVAPGDWLGQQVIFSGQLRGTRNLWQLSLSPGTWQTAGLPTRLTTGASIEVQPSVAVAGKSVRTVFSSLVSQLNVWSLPIDADGARAVRPEPQQLTTSAYDAQCSITADGAKLAFVSTRTGNPDIWLKDLRTGDESALTRTSNDEFGPVIAADGSQVLYQTVEKNTWNIDRIRMGTNGQAGPPERVCAGCMRLWDVSSDGKKALYMYRAGPRASVGLMDLESGRKVELLSHPGYAFFRVRFSPDNRWISVNTMKFQAIITGVVRSRVTGIIRSRIYVVPLRGDTAAPEPEWVAVTDDLSLHDKPVWSPNGSVLYFTSDQDGFRCIYAQRLDPATKRPLGPRLAIYHSHQARRSILNADILPLELGVARDRLVFHLAEITGNVWMLERK